MDASSIRELLGEKFGEAPTILWHSSRPLAKLRQSQVTEFKPERTKARVAYSDAAIQFAKRVRDWPLLEKAIEQKIEDQREFVAWWTNTVRSQGEARKENPDLRFLSVKEAEKRTEIKQQKVSRWKQKLKNEASYRKQLFGVAHRAAMGEAINTSRGAALTGEFERYTPAPYVEAVRQVLGEIDLDPASCVQAQKTVKAKKFFTLKDDGLKQQWHGRVFLNPPYQPQLGPAFIDKLISELEPGRVTAAILLVNNSSDTSWFRTAASKCSAICFTQRRIRFELPDKEKPSSPMYGQCFVFYGDDVAGFEDVFRFIGWGLVPKWAFEKKDVPPPISLR
jgi:hypothetical protein